MRTGGDVLNADTTSPGRSCIASTSGPATTAASTSPSRSAFSAAASSATTRTSRSACCSRVAVAWSATATVVGPPEKMAGSTVTAIENSRKNAVLKRNVLSRSLTRISRPATTLAAA